MPSPQDVKVRGVGDRSDLRVSISYFPHFGNYRLEVTPGVFYHNNQRLLLMSQGWWEDLGGNTAWLTHYQLSYRVSTPPRVEAVSIRVGSTWKRLTPLYNSVQMLYAPHWQLRPDGLWQAPINLVYPLSVYDAEGNGYYRVEELEDVGPNRYYIDVGQRLIISQKAGLLVDGLRTSPTVEVFERVYPEKDGTVKTRWAPAWFSNNSASWAFLMYPDGEVIIPESVYGNVWRFPVRIRQQSAICRYYVMNTYCVFGNVLEVFTEVCDAVRIWYDAAESDEPLLYHGYQARYIFWGSRLVCVTPSHVSQVSPPSITGNAPRRIEVAEMLHSPSFVDGKGLMTVG